MMCRHHLTPVFNATLSAFVREDSDKNSSNVPGTPAAKEEEEEETPLSELLSTAKKIEEAKNRSN